MFGRSLMCVAALFVSLCGASLSAEGKAAVGKTGNRVTPVVKFGAVPFPLQDVRLLDGPLRRAMELDRDYLLSLDADRLLHVFRIGAGLPSTAKPYGGWMAPDHRSRGEFVGLYLSACAEMYASTGDQRVKETADRVVAGLAECQAQLGGGFLHTHPDTFTTRCEAPLPFWYQIHKVLAGLMDMYTYCDNRQALEVAGKLGDWAKAGAAKWNNSQLQTMLEVEHGGINEALANLAAVTGDATYLQLALRFNHLAVLGPAANRDDRLTGLHANTQIPKFIGAAREYELNGQEWLKTAATFFWDTVVRERSYVIGGHSLGEYFTPKETLSQALGANTCETCNTYNMLKLTRHLYGWDPRAEYADYYERALYNHILASQDPASGMMCYFVPLGFDEKCRKEYCTREDSFWCCTGTGIENHAKYGDSIYFHDGQQALFVNGFVASELNWPAVGLQLRQETAYPDEGRTRLAFNCKKPLKLTLRIRHPYWAVSAFEIHVNGEQQPDASTPGSYAELARTWKQGDTVEVVMPFTVHTEAFRDIPQRQAFLYGPHVLCAVVDDSRSRAWGCPVLVADDGEVAALPKPVPDQPCTFTISPQALRLYTTSDGADITLEPMYRVHENRAYVVYWDALTRAQWQEREQAEARLAALTVDRVIPASEQSERDHNVQGENTVAGEGKWRHATDGGWFSWDLTALPDTPLELHVNYWGSDSHGREFDVLVDGQLLVTQKLDNNRPGVFYDEVYRLPPELTQGKEKFTLKFQAHPGKTAGGVFGCVLLKSEGGSDTAPNPGAEQATAQPPRAETVRDRIWIWGHPAGVYNESYLANLPKKSTIEPVAAADALGIRNMIFVRYEGKPAPPFESYYAPFQKLDRVYWSLVGASGATSADERDQVYQLAEAHPNVAGFILDDFFHVSSIGPGADPELEARDAPGDIAPFEASLSPQELHALGQRTVRGEKLPIMAVVYTGQISLRAKAHLAEVDQVCLWTWRPADLQDLENNLAKLEKLVGDKPIFLGCYMYDFNDGQPLPVEAMQRQTELGCQWLKAGRIQGMIFLATPNVDVDLEAVNWTRDWIARVGDELLEEGAK